MLKQLVGVHHSSGTMKITWPLMAMLSVCQSWSTLDKEDKQLYLHPAPAFEDCSDVFSPEVCEKYVNHCLTNQKIRKLCQKTCFDCPAVSPSHCSTSKFGCCWDGLTTKESPFDDGCPECADRLPTCYKIKDLCKEHSFVRRLCPTTCMVDCQGSKGVTCFDDPEQSEFCPVFKSSGFCELDRQIMTSVCKKTCNFCHEDHLQSS